MKNLITTLGTLLLGLGLVAACGDNYGAADAQRPIDAAIDDASSFPAAPVLGAQIDRMGRPAINTALNSAFLTPQTDVTAKKTAYNAASTPATWPATMLATGVSVRDEFATNLGLIDVLDQGTPNNIGPGAGCGKTAIYTPPASATSYNTLATVLADDMLYLDTGKPTCNAYLSLEVEIITGGSIAHSQCGGRTPSHDVIDFSYSALSSGLAGFDAMLNPLVTDGVPKHADVSDTVFPYFGAP